MNMVKFYYFVVRLLSGPRLLSDDRYRVYAV